MIERLIFEGLKGLAWLGENFPDNPRLGRRLLLGGTLLVSAIFLPDDSPDFGDLLLVVKSLCVIAGAVCLVLGTFVLFSALGVEAPGSTSARHHVIETEMTTLEIANRAKDA